MAKKKSMKSMPKTVFVAINLEEQRELKFHSSGTFGKAKDALEFAVDENDRFGGHFVVGKYQLVAPVRVRQSKTK